MDTPSGPSSSQGHGFLLKESALHWVGRGGRALGVCSWMRSSGRCVLAVEVEKHNKWAQLLGNEVILSLLDPKQGLGPEPAHAQAAPKLPLPVASADTHPDRNFSLPCTWAVRR